VKVSSKETIDFERERKRTTPRPLNDAFINALSFFFTLHKRGVIREKSAACKESSLSFSWEKTSVPRERKSMEPKEE